MIVGFIHFLFQSSLVFNAFNNVSHFIIDRFSSFRASPKDRLFDRLLAFFSRLFKSFSSLYFIWQFISQPFILIALYNIGYQSFVIFVNHSPASMIRFLMFESYMVHLHYHAFNNILKTILPEMVQEIVCFVMILTIWLDFYKNSFWILIKTVLTLFNLILKKHQWLSVIR